MSEFGCRLRGFGRQHVDGYRRLGDRTLLIGPARADDDDRFGDAVVQCQDDRGVGCLPEGDLGRAALGHETVEPGEHRPRSRSDRREAELAGLVGERCLDFVARSGCLDDRVRQGEALGVEHRPGEHGLLLGLEADCHLDGGVGSHADALCRGQVARGPGSASRRAPVTSGPNQEPAIRVRCAGDPVPGYRCQRDRRCGEPGASK